MNENEPIAVADWTDLAKLPDSERFTLEIKRGNGWIHPKEPKEYNPDIPYEDQFFHLSHYLSTHTFYGMNHEGSTQLLRKCGFNVTLANWDAEEDGKEPKP